jgi:hypothetical protein
MKKDIEIPEVKNVTLAVVREKNLLNQEEWKVYLINNNDFPIEDIYSPAFFRNSSSP